MVPGTEHRVLPSNASGPVISVSLRRTNRSWWATKYGPAKSTTCLRWSVMEKVDTIRSAPPDSNSC